MKLTKRRGALLLVVGLALLAAAFAFRPKPVSVQTAKVTLGEVAAMVDEDAITRVAERYSINAPVVGHQLRVHYKPGDSVECGDAVSEMQPVPLDPRTHAETASRLDAAVDIAQSSAAAVRSARDLLTQAERERVRIEQLAKATIVSRNDVDNARTLAAQRRAELNAAVARSDAAQHDVDTIRASLVAARDGQVVVMRAPVSGRVLRVISESESTVTAGTPIVEIGDPRRLELVVDVLSADAVSIRPGQSVMVEEWGGDKPLHAIVQRIEPSGFMKVSALGVEEQRVNVIADVIDPPPQLGDRFLVQARVVIWSGKVPRLPMTALFRSGDDWAVYAVRNGRARLQRVTLGHRGRADVEIISGLTRGDEVIVHPSDAVRNGTRVKRERG